MTEFKPQKLLFGLKLDTAKKIKDKVETEILRKYPEMQTVCRYRKEGIYRSRSISLSLWRRICRGEVDIRLLSCSS